MDAKSNGAHTPGPWVACDRGDYSDYDGNSQVIIGDDTRVAVVQNHDDDWAYANARLIAAAPDGYALAERIIEAWQSFERHGAVSVLEGAPLIHASTLEELAELANAFLAKATGGAA